MDKIKKIIKDNIIKLDVFVCIILGLIYSFFPKYYKYGYCAFKISLILKAILLFIIFLILTIIFRIIIKKINNTKYKKTIFDEIFNKKNKLYKYRIIILAAIILIVWLPIIVYLYPGTIANDTWGQLNQFNYKVFNNHHPIFDTLVFGNILFFLNNILNDWHAAFFIYVIIQATITSLVFAYSIIYAKEKLKIKETYLILFLIIYSLLPIFPCIVQNICKDTLFSWLYVLFYISYIEIFRTNGKVLEKKRNLIVIIIISLLCCLTKSIGVYVIIISYISLLFLSMNRKRIMYILGSIIILMYIILPACLKIYNIKPVGAQERYPLLFQQTARYIKYHSNDIKQDEKELLEKVLGNLNTISNVYNPIHADVVKGFSQRTETSNYTKYLLVWFKQGLRHPMTYFDATNCMLSGWISFKEYKPLMNMNNHSQMNINIFKKNVSERTWNKNIANLIQEIYDTLYNIPILKYLFTPGLYVSLIPMFSLLTILKNKKNKKNIIVFIPLFTSIIIGCFLAPTSSNGEGQRYLYPVIYTSIITIMWTIYTIQKKS